jgi:hypothetical protein
MALPVTAARRRSPPARPSLRYCDSLVLLSSAWPVQLKAVVHVGHEVLEITILLALGWERLGTDLFIAAREAAVQRTHLAPLGAINREMGGMAKRRAQDLGAQRSAGVADMAAGAGEIQLAATGKVKVLPCS